MCYFSVPFIFLSSVIVFQKRSSCQDHKYKLYLSCPRAHKNDTYLSLNISTTGNFHKAAKELRDNARRAFNAIKRKIKFDMPIRIWQKILESVIEPIALYNSPTKNSQNGTNAKLRHPLLYNLKQPNNACRAELGRYQLIIKIQKRAVKFYNHLKGSDSLTLTNPSPTEKSPNQAGPGALFTNTNRSHRAPGQATQLDPTKS